MRRSSGVDGTVEGCPTKAADVRIAAGDRFVMRTSGGGGLGPPERRDPERVLTDVQAGKVTVAGAARDYGVVIDGGDTASSTVDHDATATLRPKLRDERTRA